MNPLDHLLGGSTAAESIRGFARRAAAVDAPVLLTGESGTGKGLLARAIHALSARARRPFVAINCAGIPEGLFESEFFGHNRGAFTGAQQSHRGLFEQASGGTLFLDEIGELSLPLQAKLLTALEDGVVRRLGAERTVAVDARVIAATGQELARDVATRRFRRDLYHRLLVLSFHLPALRDRDRDFELLLDHFLHESARRYRRAVHGFEPAALARLRRHDWPGNVRELAHAVEAAVLSCDGGRIRLAHLPRSIVEPVRAGAPTWSPGLDGQGAASSPGAHSVLPAPGDAIRPSGTIGAGTEGPALGSVARRYRFHGSPSEERRLIREALSRSGGNRTRAAAALGMARNTLRAKLRAYGLDAGH